MKKAMQPLNIGPMDSSKACSFSQNIVFLIIAMALFLLIPIGKLVQQQMGSDGGVYASIAFNMAHGIGSLWLPSYTPTVFPVFYEHPPLSMYINAWFFRLLGDGFWVERLYCFFTLSMTLSAIYLLWRKTQPVVKFPLVWLLLLCWLLVPLTDRTYPNNAIEDLLVVFTTFSSWAILQAIAAPFKNSLLWLLLAALLMAAAFFTNGLQAFFPLIIPLIHYFVFKHYPFGRACLQTLYLLIATGSAIGIVLLDQSASLFMQHYFNQQVIASLVGQRGGSYSGFAHLLGFVLITINLLPLSIVTAGLAVVIAKKNKQPLAKVIINIFQHKQVLFWGLIALAASLPVLLSQRQMAHYFLQSFPFWILMFLEILTPIVVSWVATINIKQRQYRRWLGASLLLLLTSISYVAYVYGRPSAVLVDVNAISKIVPKKSMISIPKWLWQRWDLHVYFYRYYQISLTTELNQTYYLQQQTNVVQPVGYQPMHLPLKNFLLFKKVNNG